MEFHEAFLDGLIGVLIRGKLDEIYNLGGVSTVEGPHTVVEFGEAGGNAPNGKLGLHLGKPNPSIICPELRGLDSDSLDVEGS